MVLAEVRARATRRGEGSVGEGVVDQTRCGVGGIEGTDALHVREHTAHVGAEHLEEFFFVRDRKVNFFRMRVCTGHRGSGTLVSR